MVTKRLRRVTEASRGKLFERGCDAVNLQIALHARERGVPVISPELSAHVSERGDWVAFSPILATAESFAQAALSAAQGREVTVVPSS